MNSVLLRDHQRYLPRVINSLRTQTPGDSKTHDIALTDNCNLNKMAVRRKHLCLFVCLSVCLSTCVCLYIPKSLRWLPTSLQILLLQRDRATHFVIRAMFHKVWELERFQTAKVALKVIQGHWQWCHSIGHVWFPISVPLQLCLYLVPLTRYYHLFPKI